MGARFQISRPLFACAPLLYLGAFVFPIVLFISGQSLQAADKIPDVIAARPASAASAAPTAAGPAGAADTVESHVKIGRSLFQKKLYAEALKEFAAALALSPANRDVRSLAALAAYWAKMPEQSLELWNSLLDSGKRNSAEEWEIEKNRVLVLSAMRQFDAADQVVSRLYELRRDVKLPIAIEAYGFVREHFYYKDRRVGCWEVMDERKEVQDLWSFPVVDAASESMLKRLSVEAALLPGGGPGFILAEELPGKRRIYKRWIERPEYSEVRPLVVQVLNEKLKPLEESPLENAKVFAPEPNESNESNEPATATPANPVAKDAVQGRVPSDAEIFAAKQVKTLGLDPAVGQMLTVAARLRGVQFDVTRLTRLSLIDAGLADKFLKEFAARAPYAQEDAAELVELIARSKSAHVASFFKTLPKLGESTPYLDFVLLTALNTRGGAVPPALLESYVKSPDFMVRQTAATIMARRGDPLGLEVLFKEADASDSAGCAILQVSFEDLLGPVLGAAPSPNANDEKLIQAWKSNAATWWRENSAKLKHVKNPKVGEPDWKL